MNLSFGNFGIEVDFSGNLFKQISTDIEVYRVGKEIERNREKSREIERNREKLRERKRKRSRIGKVKKIR
jgi:hypothetical protein